MIVESHFIITPSSSASCDLEVVRGHPLAGAAVDDDRVARPEALGGAGGVHRRVPAAVDDDAPAEQRALLSLHACQQRDGVEDVRGLAGGDVCALADVRADGQERRVEAAVSHRVEDARDLAVQFERDAEVEDARDLGVQDIARQAVAGDAEAHHAAGDRPGVADRDRVPAPRELVGGGQAGGAGADDEHTLAGRLGVDGQLPALADRLVAEEALDAVDADGVVELRRGCRRSRTGGSRRAPSPRAAGCP